MSRLSDAQISGAQDRMRERLHEANIPSDKARVIAEQCAQVADRRRDGLPVDPNRQIDTRRLAPSRR